MRKKKS